MEFRDWRNLAKQLNANAHGHIHELMGGSWNPSITTVQPDDISGGKAAYEFLHTTEAYSKILWRYGYLECPEAPNLCDGSSDCSCQCIDYKKLKNMTHGHVLASTGIIKSLTFYDKFGNAIENWQNKTSKLPYDSLPGYTFDETQLIYNRIMDLLCNPGHIGDMFQSTSTNDVTFWVLHPTLDRLWHRLRLNAAYKLISFDDTWVDKEINCPGHYSYSTTPFKSVFDEDDVVYTNSDLYDLLDPQLDDFPYMYEHFRWSHCTALGYDMTGTSPSGR